MILILSEETDTSTSEVMGWLMYYNQPFLRINASDSIAIDNIVIDKHNIDFTLTIKRGNRYLEDATIRYSQVNSFWYRRGGLYGFYDEINIDKNLIINDFNALLKREFNAISTFIHWLLLQKCAIGSYEHNTIPKLKQLTIAKLCDLEIPTTRVVTRKQELLAFSDQDELIIKGIQEGAMISSDRKFVFGTGTNLFTKKQALDTEERFCPSLFQNKLKKLYELRIFYLDGQCYPMAIFSQQNEKTKIDFRNYDSEKPNRTVPYNLPSNIKQKICDFMNRIDMNCGSIDMVVTKDNRYVFLEVNPVGQFQQVSLPCNYYLHQLIALHLKK